MFEDNICDDRNQLEDVKKIQSMSEEQFEQFLNEKKLEQKNK